MPDSIRQRQLLAACTLILFALAAVITGCISARRSEPFAGPLALASPELVKGREHFMHHCHECHPGGEAGLGPALNNKPLPGFLIRTQVRAGLGAMPAFPEKHISDEDLGHIIEYIKTLRRHEPEGATPNAGSA